MTDIRDEVAEAVRDLPVGSGAHSYLIALDTSDDIVDALLAALSARGLTVVREGTGGVFPDGTTNHPPIDFGSKPTATVVREGELDIREAARLMAEYLDHRVGCPAKDPGKQPDDCTCGLEAILAIPLATRQPEGQ